MKANRLLLIPVLAIYLVACTGKKTLAVANNIVLDTVVNIHIEVTDTFETGRVIKQVACKRDAGQSYSLYIPAKGASKKLPVIYFFDPHGDGSLPLNKYKALAEKYSVILAGSNNSKNGNDWPATENIWSIMNSDVQQRLKIDSNRIYAAGFSGGAKVAGYAALHHPEIKTVILNGAGLPGESAATDFTFSVTAIAGEGDMNMTDLVTLNNNLEKTSTRHRIIFFDGIHQWAPEPAMDIAFAGLLLDGMFRKLVPKEDGFIGDFVKHSKQRLDQFISTNNLLKAVNECAIAISMLDGLTIQANWFKQKQSSLISGGLFKKQWQVQQKLFTTEKNIKAGYNEQFQQGDINYWTKVIDDLRIRAAIKTREGAMYQRLLAYLSLAFYSFSNRFIIANQQAEAAYFVGLYKLADPVNSEAWYFSAIINARNNKVAETEADLAKAVDLGFSDKSRMEQQAEFLRLSPPLNFSRITSAIK
jgi:predicted esterase